MHRRYIILYYTYYIHYVILLKPLRWEYVFCMCHTLYVWCSFFYCYLMAAGTKLCSICAKPIYRNHDACDLLHFHCACSQISDTEEVLFTSSGKSSFQCAAYPSSCDQHKMTTCHLGLSAYYLHLMLHILHLMEVKKKSNFPRGSCIFLNLLAMNLLVFNGRLQDSVGWPWVWLRILSH